MTNQNNGPTSKATPKPGALDGIKVVDCSQILAGPFCSMLLADMGADVIKVEKPNGGDDMRRWGPPFLNGESAAFIAMNRNKRSVVIDIKTEEGVKAVQKLTDKADVFIENYRMGAMERAGLGYEQLSKRNPRLIYCSISGFGRTGPDASRAGFDLIAQAMSGLMSITGLPDAPPVKVGVPIADLNAGMFAALGILSAWIARERTGQGEKLDISLLESALAYTVWESSIHFATGEVPRPRGSVHRLTAPYQALHCRDGWIVVAAPSQKLWETLCNSIDADHLLEDDRFKTNSDRMNNLQALETELESVLLKRNRDDWLKILTGAGLPCAPVYDIGEAWNNEQVKARDMDVPLQHPTSGIVRNIGSPIKLKNSPPSLRKAAPLLGQHTKEFLSG